MQTRSIGNRTVGTVTASAIGQGEMPLSLIGRPYEEQACAPCTPRWTPPSRR